MRQQARRRINMIQVNMIENRATNLMQVFKNNPTSDAKKDYKQKSHA